MTITTTSSTTSNASAVTALTSSLGVGSGIDMTALATNLANAQFAGRNDRLTTKADTLERQISAAANIKSMVVQLSTSLGARVRTGDLSAMPQLADPRVATATLSNTSRPRGSFSVEVIALAAGQVLASPVYSDASATVGAGRLTLRFGALTPGGFTPDPAQPSVPIDIAAGATLADVAVAINAAGSSVSAYVANTAAGARLVLKGAEGAGSGFVLDAVETPGAPGLGTLAWTTGDDPTRMLKDATDATVKVDGLAVNATGNILAQAIPGVTLRLTGTNPGAPTALTFGDPTAAIGVAMEDLTAALNQIAGELRSETNSQGGDLARDSGARALRSALAQLAGKLITPNAAPGAPRTLADLGLSTQRDGSFVLDKARLAATSAADPAATAAMFTNGLYGVFATVDGLARSVSGGSDPASMAGSIARYASLKAKVTTDQAKLVSQQEAVRASLVSRFAVADNRVGSSRSTLAFLQNQIAAWNAQK